MKVRRKEDMKKVVAALIALSSVVTPISFAQTTTSGTYNGNVATRCIVKTPLPSSTLAVTGTDEDGFATQLSGNSVFGFRSNSGCKADVSSSLQGPSASGACTFASNGTTSYSIPSAQIAQNTQQINAVVNQNLGILIAGDYALTCTVNLTAL